MIPIQPKPVTSWTICWGIILAMVVLALIGLFVLAAIYLLPAMLLNFS